MYFIRILLIALWIVVACTICLVMCLVRWGDLNLDRDIGRLLSWGVLRITRIRVECEGRESLISSQPCIYVFNHQSALDVATVGALVPNRSIIIGKKELKWIPFFGLVYMAGGNITIDRGNRASAVAGLSRVVKDIKASKASVIIFPEGTRNREMKGLLPFKKGAFYMAIEAQIPIVPVVSSPLAPIFGIGTGKRTLLPALVRFRVLSPIPTVGLTIRDVDQLTRETRDKMLEALRDLETQLT